MLINEGRRAIVPTLKVESSGSVRVMYDGAELSLTSGEYQWPHLLLTPGHHRLTYRGTGTLSVSYREAVLE